MTIWRLSCLSEFSATIETSADILSQGFPCCGLRLCPIPHIPPRHQKLSRRSLKGGLVILKCLAYLTHYPRCLFNLQLNLHNPWLDCTAVSVVKVWLGTTICDRRSTTRPRWWQLPDPALSTCTSLFLLATAEHWVWEALQGSHTLTEKIYMNGTCHHTGWLL